MPLWFQYSLQHHRKGPAFIVRRRVSFHMGIIGSTFPTLPQRPKFWKSSCCGYTTRSLVTRAATASAQSIPSYGDWFPNSVYLMPINTSAQTSRAAHTTLAHNPNSKLLARQQLRVLRTNGNRKIKIGTSNPVQIYLYQYNFNNKVSTSITIVFLHRQQISSVLYKWE